MMRSLYLIALLIMSLGNSSAIAQRHVQIDKTRIPSETGAIAEEQRSNSQPGTAPTSQERHPSSQPRTAPATQERRPSSQRITTSKARVVSEQRATPKPIPVHKNQGVINKREVLILTSLSKRRSVLNVLKRNQFEVLRTNLLTEIGYALISINIDQNLVPHLRNLLPDAEIDLNNNLSASKGPRLYAKEKIAWPDKKSCLHDASEIPIGLIDGSIDRSHIAFTGQRILEKSFLGDNQADKHHATAIASILIGNAPNQGFDGLLTGAKLYNAVALRRSPDDQLLASVEATLLGLNWLMYKGIRLINVSLAGQKNRVLVSVFKKSLEHGMLIFAAAGNNGPNARPAYPAAIDGVFAVTAIDAAGRLYKQANRGSYIDFSAPGVDIWAANSNGLGGYKSGTSYAVPYALAASALQLTTNPNLSGSLLKRLLDKTIIAQCP